MRDQRLERFSEVVGRIVPDAITASVALLLLLAAGAMALGLSLIHI